MGGGARLLEVLRQIEYSCCGWGPFKQRHIRGGHLQNIISIDNTTLDQVDIIFGPGSSEYGSDGLGALFI
ncbi:MAG: hypothetical protein CM15mP23_07700 [Cryomorphaceae bacterium]|nr:MAG: hypothetical protein CM15mP23_07700 [Cryomorphaceae bacterium]